MVDNEERRRLGRSTEHLADDIASHALHSVRQFFCAMGHLSFSALLAGFLHGVDHIFG